MELGFFALQLTLPAILGLIVAAYLKPVLFVILSDLCGTSERAEFWCRIFGVGVTLFPPAFTLYRFTPPMPDGIVYIAYQTTVSAFVGTLLVVFMMSWVIWRRIPHPEKQPTHTPKIAEEKTK